MRTHYDSIVDIYWIKQKGDIKEEIARNVLAKIETKNVSKTNEFGERGFMKTNTIFIERKTIQNISLEQFDKGEFIIYRKKAGRFEVDEWYQVEGSIAFEGKSLTIKIEANRSSQSTDTNNKGFNSI